MHVSCHAAPVHVANTIGVVACVELSPDCTSTDPAAAFFGIGLQLILFDAQAYDLTIKYRP